MKYNFKASDPLLVWQGEQVFLADSAAGYAGTSASRSARPALPLREKRGRFGAEATLRAHTVSFVVREGFEAPLVQA